jgi:hypothetical protein
MNLNFLGKFSKNNQILNTMKISPIGAELFYVDGRSYRRHEINSSFCDFGTEPENQPVNNV